MAKETTFDNMAILASPSSAHRTSPSPPRHRSLARRCERGCCTFVSYLPLFFIYGLSTWAVWVQIVLSWEKHSSGTWAAILALALYLLLNWSYTTAVFTDPGSPTNTSAIASAYTALPDQESHGIAHVTSLTVKSTGEMRFCKKCQTRKPDRTHHCSTCRRCVLKMDHHCPWLATCVGLRNYKPFILFLTYTCIFCYVCFLTSGKWVMTELFDQVSFEDHIMPVHYILLAVLSGIIGLVLSGFTGWHIYLALTGQTTIESLDKTRYLSPIRKSMQQQLQQQQQQQSRNADSGRPSLSNLGDQLREIHANALPGITRPEEGEEFRSSSPAQTSLRRSYRDMERQREMERYNDYLDERDSDKLPHAFDLGWRRNLQHLFGDNRLLWIFPICNTTGDGWQWEASQKWIDAREELAREREAQRREHDVFERDERGWVDQVDFRSATPLPRGSGSGSGLSATVPRTFIRNTLVQKSGSHADTRGSNENNDSDSAGVDEVDDEEEATERTPFTASSRSTHARPPKSRLGMSDMDNWNDIPDDIFSPRTTRLTAGKTSGAATPSRTGTPRLDDTINSGRRRPSPEK